MQLLGVLIHDCRRLGAAVAFKAVEGLSRDSMFAVNAFERNATTQRLGCVIAHGSILVSIWVKASGQWVLTS
jgi:hypothetical protein